MKKYIIPVALLTAVSTFSSCDQDRLDIEQKGVVTTETFYQTEEDAEAALVACYQGFLWNYCGMNGASIYSPIRSAFNLCGDDVYAAGEFYGDNDFMAAMDEFRYDTGSPVVKNAYFNIMYAMYYTNLLIDKYAERTDATPAMKRCVAEARVLRAFMHLQLAIGWGTPPLVDHIFGASDQPYNCDADPENPLTHDQLLQWIADECAAALPNLDERKSPSDKGGAVKCTKGFANAIAGKALVFKGDFAAAKPYLKAVIDSGKYALVSGENYWQNFHKEGDANEEKVFEANVQSKAGISNTDIRNRSTWMESQIWGWRNDHMVANPLTKYSNLGGWGGLGVPQDFADEFLANDGEDSYRFKATLMRFDDALTAGDWGFGIAELDAMSKEELLKSDKIGLDLRGLYGQSFYLPLKQMTRINDCISSGNNVRENNFTIMRYPEVILLYAEACVQTGSANDALPYVNALQERANSKTISSTLTMDVVKKEKKFEMWLEGCRWADQLRWGDTQASVNAGKNVPILYDSFRRPAESGDKNVTYFDDAKRFYTVTTSAARDAGIDCGFKEKHKLFPFPHDARAVNENLRQNPGWDD